MKIYDFKKYIFDCCRFLGIKVSEQKNRSLRLHIPEELEAEFGKPFIDADFQRPESPESVWLSPESHLARKIARLVAEKNFAVSFVVQEFSADKQLARLRELFPSCRLSVLSSGEDASDLFLMWCKTKLVGDTIEEHLKGYQCDCDALEVRGVSENFTEFLEASAHRVAPAKFSEELFAACSEAIFKEAEKEALRFIEAKQKRLDELFEKEAKRIMEYYNILMRENTGEAANELELLKSERENLIRQQKSKYSYSAEDASIEAAAVLVLRKSHQTAEVEISSSEGSLRFRLHANEAPRFQCRLTGSESGPFVVEKGGSVRLEK